jgi:phosphatidylethanolamine-binding protein (PEBP) family uncharacterized protein
VTWSGVPKHTKELALFVANETKNGGNTTDWAVVGLSPKLTGLTEGKLPAGAILGRTGAGKNRYSVCPAKGKRQVFGVALYALSRHLSLRSGFNGVKLLNKFENEPNTTLLTFSYKRK